jgi:PAS domain S-box-containing protein
MEETRATKANLFEELAPPQHKVELLKEASLRNPPEDEFVRFFAQSLDLLCITSFDGFFKCINPAWTNCLGWTPEELEATPFLDLVHSDDYAATVAEISRLTDGTETILFENRYRHQDGSYRWLSWSAQPVAERQRIYAIARDITQQKWLEAEVLNIADKEKERLGRELHDGLCQTLAGISALSTTLSKKLCSSTEPSASVAAGEIAKLLTDAISEARSLAHGLGPLNMGSVGLDGALDKLALNVQQLFHVSCSFQCEHPFRTLSHEVGAQLFRITQEAVNNAVTHGRATRIEIILSKINGTGLLCVEDDGVGISKAAANLDGIGLHTMAYRARLIGASLKVQPRTECGTSVTCTFPFHEK